MQQVAYNPVVTNSHYGYDAQRLSNNVNQAPYMMVYQGGYNQGRPITYSQPNVVVGANRGQFR
jgi:hypothetical protein